jgi:hypothetical protein
MGVSRHAASRESALTARYSCIVIVSMPGILYWLE